MFNLPIELSLSSLEAHKREIQNRFPDVKSSHRCEAIARGFGFSKNASLREAASKENMSATADAAAFCAFLGDRGYTVDENTFYLATAKVAVTEIMKKFFPLTIWGFGCGRPERKAGGEFENPAEFSARFLDEKDQLTSDHGLSAVLRSLALLIRIPKTKTIRDGTYSYRLKHIAENYASTFPNGEPLGPDYVPNGAFIAAALLAGFNHKKDYDHLGYHSPNATFNMPQRIIDDLDCEIRPTGAIAQSRQR